MFGCDARVVSTRRDCRCGECMALRDGCMLSVLRMCDRCVRVFCRSVTGVDVAMASSGW